MIPSSLFLSLPLSSACFVRLDSPLVPGYTVCLIYETSRRRFRSFMQRSWPKGSNASAFLKAPDFRLFLGDRSWRWAARVLFRVILSTGARDYRRVFTCFNYIKFSNFSRRRSIRFPELRNSLFFSTIESCFWSEFRGRISQINMGNHCVRALGYHGRCKIPERIIN